MTRDSYFIIASLHILLAEIAKLGKDEPMLWVALFLTTVYGVMGSFKESTK